jgi:hypothetical protein
VYSDADAAEFASFLPLIGLAASSSLIVHDGSLSARELERAKLFSFSPSDVPVPPNTSCDHETLRPAASCLVSPLEKALALMVAIL